MWVEWYHLNKPQLILENRLGHVKNECLLVKKDQSYKPNSCKIWGGFQVCFVESDT